MNAYGQASVPETEGLFAGGRPSFLKMAASAAHLFDKPLVGSEILAVPRGSATPAMMLQEGQQHLASGVNQLTFHGFPYEYEKGFPPPGWMPFASPYLPGPNVIGTFGTHLNDTNLFWKYLPLVTDSLARAQLVLRTGAPVIDIALYAGAARYPDDPTFDPETPRHLELAGHNYDYVNDDLLWSASLGSDGMLTVGAGRYRALVVPRTESRLSGSDPDGGALTFTVSIQAIKGRVEITNGATGDFRYTPDPLVAGADLFWFKVSDGRGGRPKLRLRLRLTSRSPTSLEVGLRQRRHSTVRPPRRPQ